MSHARRSGRPFAAIVLAGGTGRRLAGADKATLLVGDVTLLDRALAAVAHAQPVVVVGPPRELPATIRQTREDPPGGGPVSAVAAGLAAATARPASTAGPSASAPVADIVVVLACDMPFLDSAAVARLVTAVPADGDGAAYVDPDGRRQHLAAAYRISSLARALSAIGTVDGAAMRELTQRLTIAEIEADPETTVDIDTWDAWDTWQRVQSSADEGKQA